MHPLLQACGLSTFSYIASSIQSSGTDARGDCIGYPKDQTTHRESVTMSLLQLGVQKDSPVPSHHSGSCLEMQTTSADDPRHFTCFLCQFVAPDRLQLRQHLSNRHKFPCFDWIPARDCLPDQVTCAHCGSVYHSLEVVRKHIIYGFCKQFNPDRPWTQNGNPVMVDQLRLGRVDLLLADADMRKALTLTCQFCSKQFSQACNLINHLVVQHAEIAAEADAFQQILQKRYAPRGCYCMPPVRSVKQAHQCVIFLQLSMMHYNGNQLLTVPLSYDDRACDLMDTHVPFRCIQLVHDCLRSRDFAMLQQNPHFLNALKTSCLCCGKPVTLTGPASGTCPSTSLADASSRAQAHCTMLDSDGDLSQET